MATYLTRQCPQCNGYLGIVLREPGRNVPVRAVNVHCLKCDIGLAWIVIKGKQAAAHQSVRKRYARPKKTLEREALLKTHRELEAEIAQHERNLQKGLAQQPIEKQLRLRLQRVIKTNFRTWQVRSNATLFKQ
jgi:hypothetical protein